MANLKQEVEKLNLQINELNKLKSLAELEQNKIFLQSEINRLNILKENHAKAIESSGAPTVSKESKFNDKLGLINVSNYMWDQSDDFVKIIIEIDKNTKIEENEIFFEYPSKTKVVCIFGKYRFTLARLYKPIEESKTKAHINKYNRLTFTLYKSKSEHWPSLQQEANKLADSLKDDGKDADPEKALMTMMKKMYDEGDDEMKRTIMKSWYESQQKQKQELIN